MSTGSQMLLESQRALQCGGWSALQRRILAAMVVINDCTFAAAERALVEYLECENGQGFETPCKDNCDVNFFAGEAGRLIRRDQREARARLTVVPNMRSDALQRPPRRFVLVPTDGKPSNISCVFQRDAESRFTDGRVRARVLSVKQVANIKRQRTIMAKERRDG